MILAVRFCAASPSPFGEGRGEVFPEWFHQYFFNEAGFLRTIAVSKNSLIISKQFYLQNN